ncbi:MAG: DUF503 domain-containing protein [Thermoleophilia bacterium]|nr:DUF503 domain-containing protein [Thermoleophilia bacterium]
MPAPSKSSKGFVGILSAELYFPENGSLKGKRMYLRRIRDQVTRHHGVSFAEVGHQDLWQRSRIVLAVAASDLQVLDQTFGRLRVYLDSQEWIVTSCVTEVVDVDA